MNALLRILAWLLAVALVALPVVAVLNGWVGAGHWPLSRLRANGQFERVPAEQLQQALAPHAARGFFAVDLDAAQHAVEQLPWVEHARVRKQWPDTLEVQLQEHEPFAFWGQDRCAASCSRCRRTWPVSACRGWTVRMRAAPRWWRCTSRRASCSRRWATGWSSWPWMRVAAGR